MPFFTMLQLYQSIALRSYRLFFLYDAKYQPFKYIEYENKIINPHDACCAHYGCMQQR